MMAANHGLMHGRGACCAQVRVHGGSASKWLDGS